MNKVIIFIFLLFLTSCDSSESKISEPSIESFTSSSLTILAGDQVTLVANFSDGIGTINKEYEVISGIGLELTPEITTTYVLTVTNIENVSVELALTVNVILPRIDTFKTSANTVLSGTSVNLSAYFSNGEGSIDQGVGVILSGQTLKVSPQSTTTYKLSVINSNGVATFSTLTINVVPIIVKIKLPNIFKSVSNDLSIDVSVESKFDMFEVVAVVENRISTLLYDNGSFKGQMSLEGIVPGKHLIKVFATDTNMQTVTEELVFTLDNKPQIAVSLPIDYSVATPMLDVAANCTDDMGDCTISVRLNGVVFTSSDNHISEAIDLTSYIGKKLNLEFRATDSTGQYISNRKTIFVESTENLELVNSYPGKILDLNNGSALFVVENESGSELQLVNVVTNSRTEVEVPINTEVAENNSFITQFGAIYTAKSKGGNVLTTKIYDWNLGQLFELGKPDSSASLKVAGQYAIWNQSTRLWLRDLSTKINTLVSDNAGNWKNDVASNGVVAFWTTGNNNSIIKYHNGEKSTIATDQSYVNTYVLTDGTLYLYRKHDACCNNTKYALTMHDGSNETILMSFRESAPVIGRDFAIIDGWIFYTNIGNIGQTHIWARNTVGDFSQRTFYATDSYIDGVAKNGEVMFINESYRYLSKVTGVQELIGSKLGKSYNIDGNWYITIGRSLFKVNIQ